MSDETKATYTNNINLEKPGRKQKYNIMVHNNNYDKLDTAISSSNSALKAHRENSVLDHPNKSVKEQHLDDSVVTKRTIKDGEVTEAKLEKKHNGFSMHGIVVSAKGLVTQMGDFLSDVYKKSEINSMFSNYDVVGKLGQQTLSRLGVRYSIAQNGYICFGSLFGGLIIQWGKHNMANNYTDNIILPIAYRHKYVGLLQDIIDADASNSEIATFKPVLLIYTNVGSTLAKLKIITNDKNGLGVISWVTIGF